MTGFDRKARTKILIRDEGRCQWCGVLTGEVYSIQHRRARGMGGSSRPDTNTPPNGVLMCGTAVTGCHGYVESHRDESSTRGFTLRQVEDPRLVPLVDYAGFGWWFTVDGRRVTVTEPPPF